MVSWFKRPGDSKMPQRKDELMQYYLLTCNRLEQEQNCLKEGEHPVHNQEADEPLGEAAKGVAEALIQMGTAV
jgi:hypothetical protein